MSLMELFLLAVGLSMDAFAVAICKGLSMSRMSWKKAAVVGLYFGGFQALMPLIGYLLGQQFERFITTFAPWIAFLLLVLTGAARYTMKEAAGTTKAINLSSNVAAFVTFVIHGKIIYTLGLAAAICSILGNYIGSGLVMGNGQKIVRPLILVVLAILFVKILSGN